MLEKIGVNAQTNAQKIPQCLMLNAQTLDRRKPNTNVYQDHDNGHTLESLCVSQVF